MDEAGGAREHSRATVAAVPAIEAAGLGGAAIELAGLGGAAIELAGLGGAA